MQRTEMKTPSFCNPHSLYSNTEIGGAGVAATVCGPFENMGVFSADTGKVLQRDPSLPKYHA